MASAECAQKSENSSNADQRRAFAQHQPQHLRLARAQRHANSDLPAALRNRVGRDAGESDGGQHQAEHSDSAIGIDGETLQRTG